MKRVRLVPRHVLAVAMVGFYLLPGLSLANPMLDHVSYGNASIQQTATTTTVNQTSQKAIIHWDSFNIGSGEHTHFQQPTDGVALNRINANQGASEIYGSLTATGKIILTNSAGIYFGPNAYVNVGGMIATTTGISDQNFINGNYLFDQASSNAGMIVNQGTIIAAEHGLIALMGNGVQNDGTVQANLGKVIIASGETFTMSFAGNELVNFAVSGQATRGITNKGKLIADGGTVMVKAETVSTLLDNTINMQGVVQARSIYKSGGTIIISGSSKGGVVRIASKLNASGKNTGEKGGSITITGHNILLDTIAELDVSGDSGGGNINIGGSYQGKGPLTNANAVTMLSDSAIYADAINTGDGGTVILWSDYLTQAYGRIQAKGGESSGNGGFIETSSKQFLDVNGIMVNTAARSGHTGTWLLDPADLTITVSADSNVTSSTPFEPTAASSMLNVNTLTTALNSSDVLVQTGLDSFSGNGDIIIDTAISYNSDNTLTLSAYRHITSTLNGTIIENSGDGDINLRADNTGTGVGTVQFTGTTPNITANGLISIYYNPITFGLQENLYTNSRSTYGVIQYMLVQSLGTDSDASTVHSLGALSHNPSLWYDSTHGVEANYALARDLDATATSTWNGGLGFSPIGNFYDDYYYGAFDGQGYTITNLTINRPTQHGIGLFGDLNMGWDFYSIRNIGVTGNYSGIDYVGGLIGESAGYTKVYNSYANVTISASGQYIGGLIGKSVNDTVVNNSYANTTITATKEYVGGLIASTGTQANITNSHANATLIIHNTTDIKHVGGLIGFVGNNSTLSDVYHTGDITADKGLQRSGGLIGEAGLNVSITGAYNTGNITTGTVTPSTNNQFLGGVLGYNAFAGSGTITVSDAYNLGNIYIYGDLYWAGGVVGQYNRGSISDAYNQGNITITGFGNDIGGVLGVTSGSPVSLTNAYNTGNLTMNQATWVGGVGGELYGTVDNSYNTGNIIVTGSNASAVGGFVGYGSASNSYNTGNVTVGDGASLIGGFAGSSANTILHSYNQGNVVVGNNATAIGGLVGQSDAASTQSYNLGSVTTGTGSSKVGGLIGESKQNVNSSFNLGSITVGSGSNYIGGLIGYANLGQTKNSYNAGVIIAPASTNIGGVVGETSASISVFTNNYWDTDKSGISDGYGTNNGTITNLYGGCIDGTCTIQPSSKSSNQNAAVNLSLQSTYPQGAGEWDFSTIWHINEGISLPYLAAFYVANTRTIQGSTNLGSNVAVNLVANGTVLGSGFTAADGSFYLLQGNNSISNIDGTLSDGEAFFIFYDDPSGKANAFAVAPNSNGSIYGANELTLTANTINIQTNYSNTDFANALGDYSNSNILFTASSNNITFGTGLADIDFITASGTTFTLNGNLISAATNSSDFTFNGAVNVTANSQIQLSGTSTLSFNNAITGSNTITATGVNSTSTLLVDSGSAQTFHITSNDSGNITGFAGFTGTFNFNNFYQITGGSSNNNSFVFANNTKLTGTLTGGSTTNTNTLNYSAYTTPIKITFPANNNDGQTKNSLGSTITNFLAMNNLIGNFNLVNTLLTPYKPSAIVYTAVKQGYIGDPTYFYGFGHVTPSNNTTNNSFSSTEVADVVIQPTIPKTDVIARDAAELNNTPSIVLLPLLECSIIKINEKIIRNRCGE